MKTFLFSLPISLAVWTIVAFGQDCSQFNKNTPTVPWDAQGTQEHKPGGMHDFKYNMGGQCTYSGSTPGAQCAINCTSSATGYYDYEAGPLINPYYHHATDLTDNEGYAQAPNGGAQIQCQVTVAATVRSCLLTCAVSITFNASQDGVGATVNFPSDNIFARNSQLVTTCSPQQLPYCTGNPGITCCSNYNNGNPTCNNGQWSCGGNTGCTTPPPNPSSCGNGFWQCECNGQWSCQGNGSPIIIDTNGTGFQLSSAADGVRFDLDPSKPSQQLAWTMAQSRNGWLALPHDGKVETGKDLFGNFTPQPPSSDPNGFLALAVYDQPDNGGNGDGIIDWHDSVFDKLRVWIDENHNGKAEANELYTLPAVGVYSISLAYTESKFADNWGNQFRYKGTINPTGNPSGDHVDRVIYDVFLQSVGSQGHKVDPLMEGKDPLKDFLQ